MKLETRKLSDLKMNPANPRRISDKALAGLKTSIERWGLVQHPIINERTGNLVGGHQRVVAMRALGIEEAECCIIDLPEAEEKALNVALNNPGIQGRFDDTLPELMADIVAELPDLPIVDLALDKFLPLDCEENPIQLEQKFQILIECNDEKQQGEILERLTKEGLICHSLIS